MLTFIETKEDEMAIFAPTIAPPAVKGGLLTGDVDTSVIEKVIATEHCRFSPRPPGRQQSYTVAGERVQHCVIAPVVWIARALFFREKDERALTTSVEPGWSLR